MRILVGTVEIAGVLPVYADGFRRLGHQVTTVVGLRHKFHPEAKYDVDIDLNVTVDNVAPPWLEPLAYAKGIARIPGRLAVLKGIKRSWLFWSNLRRLLPLIARHDVFVFQWAGISLLDGNGEYPLLKKLGKRIVSVCNGDDVRHWSAYNQQCDHLGMPSLDLRSLGESYRNDPLVRPLRNLRMAERYSDLVLSVPNQSGLAVRPYMRYIYPMNLSEYEFRIPKRDIPVVIHAPSVKTIKGTDRILAALERLKSDNVRFDLRLLHGVSNKQVIDELTNADVAIDQLHLPPYGKFGAEAMASGCALASYKGALIEPFPADRPVWDINHFNVYDQLKRLLTDKELRIRLAQEGRRYIEHHDHVSVARKILNCLVSDESLEYDYYPSFFARHYCLPKGEMIKDDLKRMTAQIVKRWGLAEGADLQDMEARGLISMEGLTSNSVTRWKQSPSPAT